MNILIVAAHPDDEILGVGGAVLKHKLNHDSVYALILGTGALSRDGQTTDDVKKLKETSQNAAKIIGFKDIFFVDFPDNSFDSISLLNIVKKIEDYFKQIKPDLVYTHFENDLNIDHHLTFQAVMTASRPCTDYYPKQIYSFETLSSTEWQNKSSEQFRPNYYLDIKDVIDQKIEAMKEYKSEIRNYPHPRSEQGIRVLAQYRGMESGLEYAEAFYLVRKID